MHPFKIDIIATIKKSCIFDTGFFNCRNMLTYSHRLKALFESHMNIQNALTMKAYMKNTSEFLGIKTPERKALFKEFLKENAPPQYSDILPIIKQVWDMPYRELHYCAIDLLGKYHKEFQENDYLFFEKILTQNAWWDSVDSISSNIITPYFKKYPTQIKLVTERWMESDNMWLQRVCLIFQLTYREKTDFQLVTDYILVLSTSKAFFIQKAIGWALRQYARTNPQAVKNFVENHHLPPLSIREALKHFEKD